MDDYQTNSFSGTGFNLQNAGALKSHGGEAELFWLPAENTTVTAGYAYTKATFEDFFVGNCWEASPQITGQDDPGASPGQPFCDRSGDPIPLARLEALPYATTTVEGAR